MMLKFVSGACLAMLATGVCAAQDPTLSPFFGAARLESPLDPDPFTYDLQAGGPNPAQNTSPSCRGWVANQPDFFIIYDSANAWDLVFNVLSDSDTTLLIHSPGGRWYCDDDGGEGSNPRLAFENPAPGRYSIWVGTYSQGIYPEARLAVSNWGWTERPSTVPRLSQGDVADAVRNIMNMNMGDNGLEPRPDPHLQTVSVSLSAQRTPHTSVPADCPGHYNRQPHHTISFSDPPAPFYITGASTIDTTLMVRHESGEVTCDDDSGAGVNPSVQIANPRSGTYTVWMGTYWPNTPMTGTISITREPPHPIH